jgi:hypothetical protein
VIVPKRDCGPLRKAFGDLKTPKRLHTYRTLLIVQVRAKQKALCCWALQSPLTDSNRRPFLTMEFLRQPVATHDNGFGLFWPLQRAADLPLIATRCNHGAP